MIKTVLAAAAVLAMTAPAFAQSAQHQLETRYDRALAAGYKALFLCSAMDTWETTGQIRRPEEIEQWDLAGIDPNYAPYLLDLEAKEYRRERFLDLHHIAVEWADDMPPRIASTNYGEGCRIEPIGQIVSKEGLIEVQPGDDRSTFLKIRERLQVSEDDLVDTPDELASVFERFMGDDTLQTPRTTAIIVARDGERVGTAFADGYSDVSPQRTWSVAKSLAATWIGAAVHGHGIDPNTPAIDGLQPDDPRRAITIDHLLRMASGRYSDTPGNRTDPIYWGGSSVQDRARSWPLIEAPGSTFRYANNDTLLAVDAVVSGEIDTPAAFFADIGMHHTFPEKDFNGSYILSSQVWTTAADLLKFGQLYLDGGVLPDGRRVLPEDWAEYVAAPSGPQPEGRPFGYGASFWLFNNSEGVPADTYAAMGNRGQFVVIVPSRDVVIVRRGEDPSGTRFDIAAFTRDVLAALD
ncbi:serine hydrolase domain-containing protein [Erythrobacter ani]|uniref:Serine hydrolase n=1 Tax=Erythrobacter ani TaxID=2827235 RepID=A0ABS6SPH7_9SPHN|nr:serine hydrolase [Erythrobacter ani]MBV7266736.1 serine hydrolase [Erythrobacter ani]